MDDMATDPDRSMSGDGTASTPVPHPDAPASPGHKSRARVALVGLAAAVVAAGVVLGVSLSSGSNADAAIVSAVNTAMGNKTAHVVLTGSIKLQGQTVALSGTGGFDFSNDAASLATTIEADGQQVPLQLVYLGGTVYEGLPQVGQLAPGKNWVSLDLGSLPQSTSEAGVSQLGGNPLVTLHALAQQGNTVTALGASTVDGRTVQGYSVTLDPATVQREMSQADLPSWMKQAVAQVTFGSGSEDVYLDGGGSLVRMTAVVNESVGSAGQVSAEESYDFSAYGTPVSVEAPPADQVLPYQQFLQLAKATQSA